MPSPDYGAFLPTESLFSEPSAYAGVLKGEALKRASYLSSMDQFYKELDESTRRFEKQYTLAEKEFEWTKEFTEEQAEWEREYKTSALEQEKYLREREIALGRSTLRAQTTTQREAERGAMTEEEEFSASTKFLKELVGMQKTPSYDFGGGDSYDSYQSYAGTPSAPKSYADPTGDWFYGMGGEGIKETSEIPLDNWIKNLTTDKTFTIS